MELQLFGVVVVALVLFGVVSWTLVVLRGAGKPRVRLSAALMIGATLLHLFYLASGTFLAPELSLIVKDLVYPLTLLISGFAAWPLLAPASG